MGWGERDPDEAWRRAKQEEDEARERRLDAEDERYRRYMARVVLREQK